MEDFSFPTPLIAFYGRLHCIMEDLALCGLQGKVRQGKASEKGKERKERFTLDSHCVVIHFGFVLFVSPPQSKVHYRYACSQTP